MANICNFDLSYKGAGAVVDGLNCNGESQRIIPTQGMDESDSVALVGQQTSGSKLSLVRLVDLREDLLQILELKLFMASPADYNWSQI